MNQEFWNVPRFFKNFSRLRPFLSSDNSKVQFAVVKSFAYIFDKTWLCKGNKDADRIAICEFHVNLFKELKINEFAAESDADSDKKCRFVSTRIQLYCSIIGKCFILRRENWFNLSEFCCVNMKLPKGERICLSYCMINSTEHSLLAVHSIVKHLCAQLFKIEMQDVLAEHIPFLLSKWIINRYSISEFPWYFSSAQTLDEFLTDSTESIILPVLTFQPVIIPDLMGMHGVSSLRDLLTEVERYLSKV